MDALEGVGGLRLYRGGESQSGLFSFTVDGMDCEEVGQALARRGVAVPGGAALRPHRPPHRRAISEYAGDGDCPVSFSTFNRPGQIAPAAAAIREAVRGGAR